jgi:hypothetical protein
VLLRDGKTAAQQGEPANIVNDSGDGIEALSFSADGRRLLVHTSRRGVVVREMAALAKASRATSEAALAHTAREAGAVVFSAAVRSAAGQWAWGNSQGQVELRESDDAPANGPTLVVEGGLYVRALAFSPDRVTLAVSGAEPGILLWDLKERRRSTNRSAAATPRAAWPSPPPADSSSRATAMRSRNGGAPTGRLGPHAVCGGQPASHRA